MLSLVHVAVLLLPMVVGHLPSPVTQIGGENILRSLPGDITYRNYQPGDDLSLIGRQAVEFCKDNICYVAVDLKSVGQKVGWVVTLVVLKIRLSVIPVFTVVGIVQMIVPGKHLSAQDRNAICGDRQAVEFCKDNICYVAVDLKSVGQKVGWVVTLVVLKIRLSVIPVFTVVGIVQMIVPGKHLSAQDRNAICGDRPSTSRPSLCCLPCCTRAPKGNFGHLFFLKVADAYRGRGIATEMLSHTFAVLEQTHPKLISVYLHVDSDNLPAIRLYEKSGFEKIASPSSKVFLFARHM
ncbi:hypothetical protein FOZ60_016199 [Perkinsus olseni]|uniref:N-acetyltransferase domain-containing protein n=1 Tax=Perkinsus olseni TaxID=32597 RepID=A0A7J6P5Q8_PEROL|nr:hypothetical protein FOZ60_016199 [Perkinsus olseni]